jgi:hypothetical protein
MRTATTDFLAANLVAWPPDCPQPAPTERGRVRVEAGGDWPALSIERDGKWLTVHSRRDPIGEANQLIDEHGAADSRVILIVGLGFGFVLDALERREWSGRVVAFEPDAAIAEAFLQRRDWRRWLATGGLTLLIGPEYQGLDAVIPSLDPAGESPLVLHNPAIARAYPESAARAQRLAERAWFGAKANQEARRENAGRYLLNTLRNLQPIAREGDVVALANAAKGVPAILVGAGPSLDVNIPHLAELADRAVIIAADTAARPLMNAGIAPHFIVAVDPTEQNARHLIALPKADAAWLIAEPSIDRCALPPFEDRTFFGRIGPHHPWPWLASLGLDRGQLRSWGSVLTTVVDVALQLGANPIVFVGADMAFTDNRPYARGTSYEEDWRRREAWGEDVEHAWATSVNAWPLVEEQGVDGRRVRTAPHLREFRDWIVEETRRHPDRRFVNATGGGILLADHIQQASIAEALSALPALDSAISGRIRAAHQPDAEASARVRAEAKRIAGTFNVNASPIADWLVFACRPDIQDDIRRTLTTEVRRPRNLYVVPPSQRTSLGSDYSLLGERLQTSDRLIEMLSDNDRAALAELVDGLEPDAQVTVLALGDRHEVNLESARRAAQRLSGAGVLVLVDEAGTAAGAELHRVAYPLLSEDPRLWMTDRRFVDHTSRLVFISSDPASRTADPVRGDDVKWSPDHRAIAQRLAPLIWSTLKPASVRDIGCGAGYWLEALKELGATLVEGTTPAKSADPVSAISASVTHQPLDRPVRGARRDVCLCLDVAQHLPPERHDALVAACVGSADVVVFSSPVPGYPRSQNWDRPLMYWVAKFADRGYLLEDALRPESEHKFGYPTHVFDGFVIFRKAVEPDSVAPPVKRALSALVQRLEDLYMQGIWWQVAQIGQPRRASSASELPEPPVTPRVRLRMPTDRFRAAEGSMREFAFRTDAARWFATHHAEAMELLEDGQVLRRWNSPEQVRASTEGGWTLERDKVKLVASDTSDPRTNGRVYELLVPRHVAWAEQEPLERVLRLGL